MLVPWVASARHFRSLVSPVPSNLGRGSHGTADSITEPDIADGIHPQRQEL
jgi:hypothetical protein